MKPIAVVREFIVNTFLFGDDENLTEGSSFRGQRIVDSTGMLELVSFMETRFDIIIEDHELIPENLDSLENIDAFLEKKLALLGGGRVAGTA